MKKSIRSLSLILSLLLLCMALTACNPVPEMRAQHGTWNEDGSISFNGKTYLELPYCEELDPISDYEDSIWITAPDVPVLLSDGFGERFNLSNDECFLIKYAGSGSAYCVESVYDAMVASIEAGAPMLYYCIDVYLYDAETGVGEYQRKLLDDATTTALQRALAQEPVTFPAGVRLEYSDAEEIFRCSKDTLFCSFAFTFMYYDEENVGYIRTNNPEDGSTTYYPVAESDLPLLLENLLYT